MKANRYLVSWVNFDGSFLGRREIRAQSDVSAIRRGQRIVRQEKAFGFWCWDLSDGFRVVHDGDLRVGG